jgi:hypothetical protein
LAGGKVYEVRFLNVVTTREIARKRVQIKVLLPPANVKMFPSPPRNGREKERERGKERAREKEREEREREREKG